MIQRLVKPGPIRHRFARAMANTGPTLYKFIVYAPDKTDNDTFQKRLSVRGEHLEAVTPKVNAGIVSALDITVRKRWKA
jgi:hypothetical protein